VSIEFGLYYDLGGAHPSHKVYPSHGVYTLILDAEGKVLDYRDLFLKMEGLWKFLSEYARGALRPALVKNKCWEPSQIESGLASKAESFKYFAVTPKGLTLIFPECQLASYACGEHRCDVPLAALTRFLPKPGVWDSASGAAVKTEAAPPSGITQASPVSSKRFPTSFDCAKASNPVENAVCADPYLAEFDVSVASDYKKALNMVADKAALRAEQRQWLERMHRQCNDTPVVQCIQYHYRTRLSQLRQHMDHAVKKK
jgi:uncharacterized protein YecT (DUF1311 family)